MVSFEFPFSSEGVDTRFPACLAIPHEKEGEEIEAQATAQAGRQPGCAGRGGEDHRGQAGGRDELEAIGDRFGTLHRLITDTDFDGILGDWEQVASPRGLVRRVNSGSAKHISNEQPLRFWKIVPQHFRCPDGNAPRHCEGERRRIFNHRSIPAELAQGLQKTRCKLLALAIVWINHNLELLVGKLLHRERLSQYFFCLTRNDSRTALLGNRCRNRFSLYSLPPKAFHLISRFLILFGFLLPSLGGSFVFGYLSQDFRPVIATSGDNLNSEASHEHAARNVVAQGAGGSKYAGYGTNKEEGYSNPKTSNFEESYRISAIPVAEMFHVFVFRWPGWLSAATVVVLVIIRSETSRR